MLHIVEDTVTHWCCQCGGRILPGSLAHRAREKSGNWAEVCSPECVQTMESWKRED